MFSIAICRLWRQMAIENTVSIDFDLRSSIVLAFSIDANSVWGRYLQVFECLLRKTGPQSL